MNTSLRVLLIIVGGALYFLQQGCAPGDGGSPRSADSTPTQAFAPSDSQATALARAFEERRSGIQVLANGVVIKTLADDNDGSRHQRFILELSTGQTVLVAHNIDLAPRVDSLRAGDSVSVYGEYEWNAKGGVIHWTHRDPGGAHVAGWVKQDGRTYQ